MRRNALVSHIFGQLPNNSVFQCLYEPSASRQGR